MFRGVKWRSPVLLAFRRNLRNDRAKNSLLKSSLKGVGVVSACGFSYCYGAYHLTPFDFPEMAVRSLRLAVTVLKIILNYRSIKDLPPDEKKLKMPDFHVNTAQMLYDMCCENRGTYIKVGQHIGAMEYLLPYQYIERFKTLHSDAPKSTEAEVRHVVKEELGAEIEEIFDEWDWTPLGAASLAQCHRARLKSNGRVVAVKVQHKDVRHSAHLDLMLMEFGVLQCEKMFPEFKLGWLARTTRNNLPRELDFTNEVQNAEKARFLLKDIKFLHIPKNLIDLCTKRILVMDYMPGIQVNEKEKLEKHGIDVSEMMKRVTQMYSEMIFNHGFIHCDPHPGNVLIRSGRNGPQVILIDHGLYQTVNDEFRFNYSSLWKALIKGDLKAIRQAAKYLNVEDMFPLLSAMVSGRSWQSVKQGLENTEKISTAENELIQKEISMWIPEMSTVLENVPKEMILIFKTNDLLRGLETTLDVRPDANAFITMSEYCLRAIYEFKCQNEQKVTYRDWFEYQKTVWAIYFFKIYLRITNRAEKVRNLEEASKEERMVEWENSFERTASA